MHIYAVMHIVSNKVTKWFNRQYNSYFEGNIKYVKMEKYLFVKMFIKLADNYSKQMFWWWSKRRNKSNIASCAIMKFVSKKESYLVYIYKAKC